MGAFDPAVYGLGWQEVLSLLSTYKPDLVPVHLAEKSEHGEGIKMGEDDLAAKIKQYQEQHMAEQAYKYDQIDNVQDKLTFLEHALYEAYGCDRIPPGTWRH